MLFGTPDHIATMQVVENVSETPERTFEMDPAALFAALRVERAGGARIVGYWHSHPSGEATPSITDARMAAPDGKLWLIAAGGEERLWRAVASGAIHGRFNTVSFTDDGLFYR